MSKVFEIKNKNVRSSSIKNYNNNLGGFESQSEKSRSNSESKISNEDKINEFEYLNSSHNQVKSEIESSSSQSNHESIPDKFNEFERKDSYDYNIFTGNDQKFKSIAENFGLSEVQDNNKSKLHFFNNKNEILESNLTSENSSDDFNQDEKQKINTFGWNNTIQVESTIVEGSNINNFLNDERVEKSKLKYFGDNNPNVLESDFVDSNDSNDKFTQKQEEKSKLKYFGGNNLNVLESDFVDSNDSNKSNSDKNQGNNNMISSMVIKSTEYPLKKNYQNKNKEVIQVEEDYNSRNVDFYSAKESIQDSNEPQSSENEESLNNKNEFHLKSVPARQIDSNKRATFLPEINIKDRDLLDNYNGLTERHNKILQENDSYDKKIIQLQNQYVLFLNLSEDPKFHIDEDAATCFKSFLKTTIKNVTIDGIDKKNKIVNKYER